MLPGKIFDAFKNARKLSPRMSYMQFQNFQQVISES